MRVHTPNPGQPYLGGAVVNDGVYKRQGVLQGLGAQVFQSLIRDKRDNNGGHYDRDPPCPSTTLTPSGGNVNRTCKSLARARFCRASYPDNHTQCTAVVSDNGRGQGTEGGLMRC